MTREMLTGNAAAAWGVRLAGVEYIPPYPITPQTEIIETLAKWISDGVLDARFVTVDSEHSMITAAGAASATGVRVFTATSSQGLLYGFEMLYSVAGWGVPILMAYRLAEDVRVLLPVLVNMDGFYLSFTREPVEIPDLEKVRKFLPAYQPRHAFFKESQPMAQGAAVIGG